MDSNITKNIIDSYNRKNKIWSLIIFFTSCSILLFQINLIIKLVLWFCFFIITCTIVTTKLKNIYIYPILTQELNPQKYYAVICGTNNTTKFAIDEIYIAFLLRDYNSVINICNLKLKEKNIKLYKYYYIQFLSRAYFELGDFENLRLYCEKFYSELAKEKNQKFAKKIKISYGNIIEYYKNYLDGNFKNCKERYKSLLENNSSTKNNINGILTSYSYAIACFKLNEFDEAKHYFTEIINNAPLLGLSETAKNYIKAIENSAEYTPENQTVEIEENYKVPNVQSAKPPKKNVILGIISMILLASLICIFSYSFAPKTLDKALTTKEGMTELISAVEINGEKDLLCFYNTKHNGYTASFLDNSEKNKYKVKLTSNNVSSGNIIEFGIAKNDILIKFAIYEEALDIPAERLLIETFTEDGKTKYFCLLSVEKQDCKISHSSSYPDPNVADDYF